MFGSVRICAVWPRLVRQRSNVTRVVRIRPHAIGGTAVTWSSKIAKRPCGRPITLRSSSPWERHANFDVAAREAKLVPALQHAGPETKVVIRLLGNRDDELAVFRRNRVRIVPFEIGREPIVQIDSFPKRIIARPEGAAVGIELVRKHQVVRLSIETCTRLCTVRSVFVDQIRETRLRYLARSVDAANVPTWAEMVNSVASTVLLDS